LGAETVAECRITNIPQHLSALLNCLFPATTNDVAAELTHPRFYVYADSTVGVTFVCPEAWLFELNRHLYLTD